MVKLFAPELTIAIFRIFAYSCSGRLFLSVPPAFSTFNDLHPQVVEALQKTLQFLRREVLGRERFVQLIESQYTPFCPVIKQCALNILSLHIGLLSVITNYTFMLSG